MPLNDPVRARLQKSAAAYRRAELRLEARRSDLYESIADARRSGLSVTEVAGIAQVGRGTVTTAERAG